jgi:hypothetical protein
LIATSLARQPRSSAQQRCGTRSTLRCEIVYAKRRLELIALLGEEGRFDFDAAEHAWGGED